MNTNSGMLPLPKGDGVVAVTPARKALSRFPMTPPSPPLKQREYPYAHQMMVVTPMDTKLWIMMVRTFLRPTSPP